MSEVNTVKYPWWPLISSPISGATGSVVGFASTVGTRWIYFGWCIAERPAVRALFQKSVAQPT